MSPSWNKVYCIVRKYCILMPLFLQPLSFSAKTANDVSRVDVHGWYGLRARWDDATIIRSLDKPTLNGEKMPLFCFSRSLLSHEFSNTALQFSKFTSKASQSGVGTVGAVGKISAFRPQNPQFDSRFSPDLNICVTFFPELVNSAFHPSGVGKWVPVSAGS